MKRKLIAVLLALFFLAGCAGPAGIDEQSLSDTNAFSSEQTSSQQTDVSGEPLTGDEISADTQTRAGDTQTAAVTSNQSGTITTAATTSPATANSTLPQKSSVSLYIDCVNAVTYGIRDRDGYKDLIPANGVMLNTVAELQQGDTVLSLLERVLKDKSILLNKGSRGYIRGIGGLKELDCGTSSGWIYSVNEIFPLTGSNEYKLVSGDRVAFYYTVKKGDVPGKQDF